MPFVPLIIVDVAVGVAVGDVIDVDVVVVDETTVTVLFVEDVDSVVVVVISFVGIFFSSSSSFSKYLSLNNLFSLLYHVQFQILLML